MAHKISWDNAEKTVILQEYLKGATKDDLYLLAQESAAMLATVPHTVHLIIDETNIQLTVNSADIRYLEKIVPKNQGAIVLIPPANSLPFKKMMQTIGQKFAPKAFGEPNFASSLEEARSLLREHYGVNYAEADHKHEVDKG